jgi:hypothetical protein
MRWVAFSLLSLSGLGCIPAELRTLELPAETSVVVPSARGAPDTRALSTTLNRALTQSFETSTVDADAVESARVTELRLTARGADRAASGLGFLQRASFSVAADGVEPIQVASADAAAFAGEPGPATVALALTGNELVEVAKASEVLRVVADVEPESAPAVTTTVDVSVVLTVVVDPLAALSGD